MKQFLVELAYPPTDAAVMFQVVCVLVLWVVSVALVRRDRDLVLFFTGLMTISLAWFALRALH